MFSDNHSDSFASRKCSILCSQSAHFSSYEDDAGQRGKCRKYHTQRDYIFHDNGNNTHRTENAWKNNAGWNAGRDSFSIRRAKRVYLYAISKYGTKDSVVAGRHKTIMVFYNYTHSRANSIYDTISRWYIYFQ